MKKSFIRYHVHKGLKIPIKVSVEWRKNVRISIGNKYVNLRLPPMHSSNAVNKHMKWAEDWLDVQLNKNPALLKKFEFKTYLDGDPLIINDQKFTLHLEKQNRTSVEGKIIDQIVKIKLPAKLDAQTESEYIKKILSRCFANHFKPYVFNRILDLNDKHFQEKIYGIRIKYNKSNWGSCSAKGNINISSRLLFAPKDVQDYVFIHELTHLKELNHSPRFWSIIASIVPDYKDKETWLKQNGHLCDF